MYLNEFAVLDISFFSIICRPYSYSYDCSTNSLEINVKWTFNQFVVHI